MTGGSKKSYVDVAREHEARGNRGGRNRWELYAQHRQHLTAAILDLAPATEAGPRLALLGAGNANDVDLDRLAERFGEIHLVDIDPSALSRAQERVSAPTRAKLRTHAPVDLSGVYHAVGAHARKLRTSAEVDALIDPGAADLERRLPRGLDLVVSCCVVTQMQWGLERALGSDHALLVAFEQAMMRIHLRTLAAMTAPGRTALFVSDLVSSRTYPLEEQAAAEPDLKALVQRLADGELVYRASNPSSIRLALRRDRALSASFDEQRMGTPWLWTAGDDATYLVYSLLLRRAPHPHP